jgi:hypothetical protein
MVADSPTPILVDINESVTPHDLGTINPHGEFVDTSILTPVDTFGDFAFNNSTGWLLLEEIVEIILNGGEICARNV